MTADYQLALAYLESHPREAARTLETMTATERADVLREVPAATGATVLREVARGSAADAIAALGPAVAAPILDALPADEAAGLLRRLPDDDRDRFLADVPQGARDRIARVLKFPDGTAGSLMDPSILDLPDDITVADAQDRVRGAARDLLYYLYVVNRVRQLVGVLDIPELMSAAPGDSLRAVMHPRVDRLSAWAPPSVIRAHPGWRSYHAMPVVDDNARLLGAIRYQTLRRLEEDASTSGPPPATMTALALGELFHIGVTGLVGSLASVSKQRVATRPPDPDSHARPEGQRG